MKLDTNTYKLTDKGNLGTMALTLGLVGLGASAFGFMQDKVQFYHSYLVAFFFWLTVALGALFFILLHHLTRANWSTVLRRLSESIMSNFPLMLVLFVPVLLGIHDLYHWSHEDAVATDHLLQVKAPYLNVPFFLIRVAFYFTVWTVLALKLIKFSQKQDIQHEDSLYLKMRKVSAPGMLLFAFTLTFASIDWLMSLEPHWYSTIFGVYIFAGSFVSMIAFTIIITAYLKKQNILTNEITVEHRHNLGKLLFAFTVFWAYIGFSQYLLIWYANLPEEAFWFLQRWEGNWKIVSIILPIGHFGLPFLMLIPRAAKRSFGWLLFMAVYMLIMHYIDIYWIVMPNHLEQNAAWGLVDLSTFAGIGGIFVWLFWRTYTAGALVPVKDPGLKLSMEQVN